MPYLTLDDVKKLRQKKYRQRLGYFLAEGEHLVQELEKALPGNPALADSRIYVTEEFSQRDSSLAVQLVSNKVMAQLSDTKTPQGVVACVPTDAVVMQDRKPVDKVLYFNEIQDPGNLGTILRTLAWFGGFRCLLSPGSVDPFNGKVVRASMGAIFHVALEVNVSPETIKERFTRIACLDMAGGALTSPAFRLADCYLFGNEARGLPAQLLNDLDAEAFSIAGSGQIDSLNLASVVNMCAYELKR